MDADKELDQFMSDLIDEKKLDGVDAEIKQDLIEDMKERFADILDRRMVDALPDDKVEGFNDLLDQDDVDNATLQQYLLDAGVEVQQLAVQTLLEFREIYLR